MPSTRWLSARSEAECSRNQSAMQTAMSVPTVFVGAFRLRYAPLNDRATQRWLSARNEVKCKPAPTVFVGAFRLRSAPLRSMTGPLSGGWAHETKWSASLPRQFSSGKPKRDGRC